MTGRFWVSTEDGLEPVSLSELIHQDVRAAIETAVHEELRVALGAQSYQRIDTRRGYRNGTKVRQLTGPSGPVTLRVPRAMLFGTGQATEWTSTVLPRYQRRMRRARGEAETMRHGRDCSHSSGRYHLAGLGDGHKGLAD
jgi:transposase-like protein